MNLVVYFMTSLIGKISDSLFFNLITFVQHVMCYISFISNWKLHLPVAFFPHIILLLFYIYTGQ